MFVMSRHNRIMYVMYCMCNYDVIVHFFMACLRTNAIFDQAKSSKALQDPKFSYI
eukprot:TRINITY_DN12413_c0_g1_i1.p2 TRINITY_DN12413_c0_g1~~TRINITY_DN12413_c0_g1_i1.p2  ORF type:complete len:55 (-),score=0.71 TRINITY_DN12413_c0_g1_i1:30-194(-)